MKYLLIFFILCACVFAQSNIDEDHIVVVGQASAFTVGSELVTDGGFATLDNWTEGTWTLAAGVVSEDNAGGDSDITQNLTSLTDGRMYRIQFEVTAYTDGNVTAVFDGVEIGDKSAVGVYTGYLPAIGTDADLDIRADATFTGSVDNVSVVAWVGDLNAGSGCTIDTFTGTLTDYMSATGGVLHTDTALAITNSTVLITIEAATTWDTTPQVGSFVKVDFSGALGGGADDGIYKVLIASTTAITINILFTAGDQNITVDEIWIGGAYPDIATAMNDSTLSEGPLELAFTSGGTTEVTVGSTIEGETGGATAKVLEVKLVSGTWGAGSAAGFLVLVEQVGAFQSETIKIGANLNVATIAADSGTKYFKRYICVNVDQEVDAVTDFVAETSETALREDDGSRKIIGFYDSISVVQPDAGYRVVSDIDKDGTYYGGALTAFQTDESFTIGRTNGKWIEWNAKGNSIHILEKNTSNFEMRNIKIYNTATGGTNALLHVDDASIYNSSFANCWFGTADLLQVDDNKSLSGAMMDCYIDDSVVRVSMADIAQTVFSRNIFNRTSRVGISNVQGSMFTLCLFYKGADGLRISTSNYAFVYFCVFFDQTEKCIELSAGAQALSPFYNNIFSPVAAADIAIGISNGSLNAASANNIMYSVTAGAVLTNPIVHDQISPNPPLPVGTIEKDPLFVDPANGDFRLRASSPALNGGMRSLFNGWTTIGATPPYSSPNAGYRSRYNFKGHNYSDK